MIISDDNIHIISDKDFVGVDVEKQEIMMAALLVKNRIETYDQLHAHRDDCQSMIAYLCDRRAELNKEPITESISTELNSIREKLKVLRREVRLCGDIETDSVALQKKREALNPLAAKEPVKVQHPPTRRDKQRD